MDLKRTLNVLRDIHVDEQELKTQELLARLRDLYTQNPDGDAIPEALKILEAALVAARVNEYTPSNVQILKEVGGFEINGLELSKEINSIVLVGPHPKVVADRLSEVIKERKTFLENISRSLEGFENLIEESPSDDGKGEIGIRLPISSDSLPEVNRQLEEWNNLIKALHYLCDKSAGDARLTAVSNGSVWLFFQESLQCLSYMAVILAGLTTAAVNMQKLKSLREEYGKSKLSEEGMKKLADFEEDKARESIKVIVNEILDRPEIKKLFEPHEINALRTSLNAVIGDLAKSIQNGLIVEVKPPKLLEEPSNETDPAKLEKQKLINEQLKTIHSAIGIANEIANGKFDFSSAFLLPDRSSTDNQPEHGVDDVGGAGGTVA